MELIVCQDSSEVVSKANAWCKNRIAKSGAQSVFLPAGQTPAVLYKAWELNPPEFLRGLSFLQIDEILSGPKQGEFKKFFQSHLPSYADHMEWIGEKQSQADLSILGLGLNGHVAFHEPGLPLDFDFACVKLSDETRGQLDLAPNSWGVTYGVGVFMRSQAVLMIATGVRKAEIVKKLLNGEGQFPALQLKLHRDFTLLVDQAANSGITL